jgi:ketosteroid isomerase-like protein
MTFGFVVLSTTAFGQERQEAIEIQSMYASRFNSFQSASTPEAQADAYVLDVADDAVWMPQNAAPVRGKAAVRAYIEEFFRTYILETDSQVIESLDADGELASRRFMTDGTYVIRATGKRVAFDQKYIDVLKKQPDGSWKITLHMWSNNNSEPSIWD